MHERSPAGLIIAAVLATSLLGGCAALNRRPRAQIVGVRLHDISLDSATLMFEVELDNPYDAPLPMINVDYALECYEKQFLAGEAELQGTIPARSTRIIAVPARFEYLRLLEVGRRVKPGSVIPYRAELGLSVDAPILGKLRLPMRREGRIPVPAPPQVSVVRITWDKFSLRRVGGRVTVEMVNPNEFPLGVTKVDYSLALGGTKVAGSSLAREVTCQPHGGKATLEIPIGFSPKNLGLALFRLISGRGSSYRFRGAIVAETPFGPMTLAVDTSGDTEFER